MINKRIIVLCVILFAGATTVLATDEVPIDQASASAGGTIAVKGQETQLYEGSLKVGDNFLDLVKGTDLDLPFRNHVTIVSTVPSIDTPVCELQTHEIAGSDKVNPEIDLITISRDLPFAQQRFLKEAGLPKRMEFVSDYKTGNFGRKAGLMIRGSEILARSVMVLDKDGVIRYLQVVPELSHLPDVSKAIEEANKLAASK